MVLGGAAVYRCDKRLIFSAGVTPQGRNGLDYGAGVCAGGTVFNCNATG
jgi:hypothetical protein